VENVYMYGRATAQPFTETHPHRAHTKKGKLRGRMAQDLLADHRAGRVQVALGRASDYFGPRGGAQSNHGDRVYPAAISGETATVLGDPDQPHTYTYIPDIGEGLAVLAEHPDALGEIWHLPNDPETRTTRQLVDMVYRQAGKPRGKLRTTPTLLLRILGLRNPTVRELVEMRYLFQSPFIVDSSKITARLGVKVVGVCRESSVGKLDAFKDRITVIPGATDDRDVIRRAVAGCDGVLTVLVPRGVNHDSTGTAQAVLDHAEPGAPLVFSCGWHITRDGKDVYPWRLKAIVKIAGPLAKLARFADLDDQVEACRRVFASDTRWTVVRGSDLQEGDSQGPPVWSRHAGDPILKSNRTRRVDFAQFMVDALTDEELGHEAPAIVGHDTPSALAYAGATRDGSI
jgi:hypothetical protein